MVTSQRASLAVILLMRVVLITVADEPTPVISSSFVHNSLTINESYSIGTVLGWVQIDGGNGLTLTSSKSFIRLEPDTSTKSSLKNKVVLNKDPDRDRGPDLQTITISGENSKYAANDFKLTIIINDINDETPEFEDYPKTSIDVAENAPIGKTIWNIEATDLDLNDVITYSLQTIDSKSKNAFTIDKRSGVLSISQSLDYESTRFYSYKVFATDKAKHNRSVDIFITIKDVQDTPPSFENDVYNAKIKEDVKKDHEVIQVLAHDGDKGVQNDVNYIIANSTCPNLFRIANETGNIYVAADDSLDRDEGVVWIENGRCSLTIKATEGKEHAQVKHPVQDTVYARVYIQIEDVNDNGPKFSQATYNASIDENTPKGVPLTMQASTIKVTDKDQGRYSQFTIQVASPNDVYFEAMSDTFESGSEVIIRVKNSTILDYETNQHLEVELIAEDAEGKFNDTCKLYLNIINLNDNWPQFNQTGSLKASVEEGQKAGFEVITVEAHDADCSDFGKVHYSIEGSESFVINTTTGVVSTNVVLDREKQNKYQVTVAAIDSGQLSKSIQLSIEVIDVNDEVPQFATNFYETSLIEEVTQLKNELTFHATDGDEPNSKNSQIKYAIVSTSPDGLKTYFSINETSGILDVVKGIDFETWFPNGGPGNVKVNVSATDQGTTPLSDYVTAVINLQDVNDNTPKCTNTELEISMKESNVLHENVVLVMAIDNDATEPNNLTFFELDSKSTETFLIDRTTGQITTVAVLDRETQDEYNINVTVSDRAVESKNSTCRFHLTIEDVNDSPPEFNKPEFRDDIYENRFLSFSCNASDADEDHDLSYKIDWLESTLTIAQNSDFTKETLMMMIEMDPKKCHLTSNQTLDREKVKTIQLVLVVEDTNATTGKQEGKAKFVLDVMDKNDEKPEFMDASLNGSIVENRPPGSTVILHGYSTILVKDLDQGTYSDYNVTLLNHKDIFKVMPEGGHQSQEFTITTLVALDYEKQTNYTLHLMAAETNTPEQQNSTTVVTVSIVNVNDNIPKFQQNMFKTEVPEDSTNGTWVGTVKATDDDIGNFGKLTYTIMDGSDKFVIDPQTGNLSLDSSCLDREATPSYSLTVSVHDGGNFSSTAQVTVTVLDVNDNKPRFPKSFYQTTVKENRASLTPAFFVTATDLDVSEDLDASRSNNSKIEYSLQEFPETLQSNITIDPSSGQIKLSTPLDYEALDVNLKSAINFQVLAIDGGQPPLNSSVNVTITVEDVNDEPPLFVNVTQHIHVPENTTKDSFITKVQAEDGDGYEANKEILYSLDALSSLIFKIHSKSGEITLANELNREMKAYYVIRVIASDSINQANTDINVTVDDINDEKPAFDKKIHLFQFMENTDDFANLTATDEDLNAELRYSIDWDKSSGIKGTGQYVSGEQLKTYVLVNETNGWIFPNETWDREEVQEFRLEMEVRDINGEIGEQKTSVSWTISIMDENDNTPTFIGGPTFSGSIRENSDKGSEVKIEPHSLTVSDRDKGTNSDYEVTLLNHTDIFKVMPEGGHQSQEFTITTLVALDYEKQTNYTLHLMAAETSTPEKLNSTTVVTVSIVNVNDNIPKFEQNMFKTEVPEDSTNGTWVGTVKATDDDIGIFGKLTYTIMDGSDKFVIDPQTGNLSLDSSCLDREATSSYSLTVSVHDGGNFSSTAQVTVTVLDVNDNKPRFLKSFYQTTVLENRASLTPAFFITATDLDVSEDLDASRSNNSKIEYSLQEFPETLQSNITIDPSSGQIKLSTPLDYEALDVNLKSAINFQVLAIDGGQPPLNSSVNVTITVEDVNDEPPLFVNVTQHIHVPENTTKDSFITKVQAEDGDGYEANKEILYSLDTLSSLTFKIDSKSGEITLANELNREVKEYYVIRVIASDSINQANTDINVTVDDINDEKPAFDKKIHLFQFMENTDYFANLTATDKDLDAELRYSIDWAKSSGIKGTGQYIRGEQLKIYVLVNETNGWIFPNEIWDREEVQEFRLEMEVRDINGEIGEQKTSASLTISIMDENDNTPTFIGGPTFNGSIRENSDNGSKVKIEPHSLTVSDRDKGNYSVFKVTLLNHTDIFEISPEVGRKTQDVSVVVVNSNGIDYERHKEFILELKAEETQTIDKFTSTATVTISVINENDNSPKFEKDSFRAEVNENSKSGTHIINITAVDKDIDKCNEISYKLVDLDQRFKIDEMTGEVVIDKSDLDYEVRKLYTVSIIAEDDCGLKESVQLSIHVTDMNDETPKFTQQEYSAHLKEGEKKFTTPVSVQANDKDDTPMNSNISYEIVDNYNNDTFSVNETSGEIHILSELDYEKDNSEIIITIRAQDHGTPSRNSTARLEIILQDVNDFEPCFTDNYRAMVKENESEGCVITTVNATDKDGSSPNNELFYIIYSGGQDKFKINSSSGDISLGPGSKLDREQMRDYNLTVLAVDKGIPSLTATTTIHITVEDINDTPPSFSKIPELVEVEENCTIDFEVANVTAEDKDEDAELRFEILWDDSVSLDEKGNKVEKRNVESWFSMTSSGYTGIIKVNSTLDRETAESLVLRIQVKDINAKEKVPQINTATVSIKILDVNDNSPVITGSQSRITFNVSEATDINTEITKLEATDKDKDQKVTFSLVNSQHFEISLIGKLKLIQKLDRENQSHVNFTALATDNGKPPKSSSVTIFINVLDANDEDPKFQNDSYTFEVCEHADINTTLGKVSAKDLDEGDNGHVSYQIKGFSPFDINKEGNVFVKDNSSLDREKQAKYSLTVTAFDNPKFEAPRYNSVLITVIVKDINDHDPKFLFDQYEGQVSETSENGTEIPISPKQIQAEDGDSGQNANITYTFENDTELFTIDESTGRIEVKSKNLRGLADIVTLAVIAQDQGNPQKRKSKKAWLTIQILDENINTPQFTSGPLINISVPECIVKDTLIWTANATDKDKNRKNNGRIQYYLVNNTESEDWKYFSIDQETGKIKLKLELDHEIKKKMKFQVMARDCGLPPLSSSISVIVNVRDINDKPPKFLVNEKSFYVNENRQGVKIGSIEAVDGDENKDLVYSIDEDLYKDYFNITRTSQQFGDIYVIKPLDREETISIRLGISVTDEYLNKNSILCNSPTEAFLNQNANARDEMRVSIHVKDVDDNPPRLMFNETSRLRGILSTTDVGTVILDLSNYVHDNDSSGVSKHNFFIVGDTTVENRKNLRWSQHKNPHPFEINANGSLFNSYKFSEDARGVFTIHIKVNDSTGSDVSYLKIYIVGDSQTAHLTFYRTEEDLRGVQDSVTKALKIKGYTIIADNILPYSADEGELDGSKSILVVHAVDEKGNVMEGEKLIGEIDSDPKLMKTLQGFKVLGTKVGNLVTKKLLVKSDDDKTKFTLIAVIAVIMLSFIITLYLLIHNIRRFKRKLKAATLDVTVMKPMNQENFPGIEKNTIKDSNPIFLRDDLVFADTDLDDQSYIGQERDSVSMASADSLDINAVDAHYPGQHEPKDDEQEVTLDFYGPDEPPANPETRPDTMRYVNVMFQDEEGHSLGGLSHDDSSSQTKDSNSHVGLYYDIIDRSQLECSDI